MLHTLRTIDNLIVLFLVAFILWSLGSSCSAR